MKNLTYQPNGSVLKLLIKGDTAQEMEDRYLSLYNWNVVNSREEVNDLLWLCWTTREKMVKYLTNLHLFKLLDEEPNRFKGCKGGAMALAKTLALEELESIPQEPFVNFGESESSYTYDLGVISAEKPDTDLKDYFITRAFAN